MKAVLRNLLILSLVKVCAGQVSVAGKQNHFDFDCGEVKRVTHDYLSQHGLYSMQGDGFEGLKIFRFELTGSIVDGNRRAKQWTDSEGRKITDLKVWRTYAGQTADKLPLGIWRV